MGSREPGGQGEQRAPHSSKPPWDSGLTNDTASEGKGLEYSKAGVSYEIRLSFNPPSSDCGDYCFPLFTDEGYREVKHSVYTHTANKAEPDREPGPRLGLPGTNLAGQGMRGEAGWSSEEQSGPEALGGSSTDLDFWEGFSR